MADTPEGAVSLSDADLDDIIRDATGEETDTAADTVEESEGAASDSVEAQEPDQDTTDETGEGATEEEAADATAETPEEGAAPVATAERPFTFKGAGQVHSLPGAVEQPDGSVRIAKDGAERLRQTLASAVGIQQDWKTQRRTLEKELRTARESRADKDIEAESIVTLFQDVRTMTPEERWEWANEFDASAPKLELEIEKQKLERDRQMLQRERAGPELSPDEQREQVQETLTTELRSTFQRLMSSPEAKTLSHDDQLALWNKWSKKADRLVSMADRDMPEYGITKGEPYFDDQDVVDDFVDRVTVRSQARGTLSAADKNKEMNADQHRGNAIPPVAKGRTPASTGKKTAKKLKGKDFERAFMRGQLDDLE